MLSGTFTRGRKRQLAQDQADVDAAAVRAVAIAADCKFHDGDSMDELMNDRLPQLSGRVCRAATADGFRTLHPDGIDVKPWSWVVGEDGLRMLLLGRRSVIERLCDLGFTDAWIRAKLNAGESFRLALFPAAQAVPATWDGLLILVRTQFPRVVAAKVGRCEVGLRATPFERIEARARAGFLRGASYFEVNEAATGGASADPRYIDTARLASDEVEGSLEEVRGWLYFVLGCSELFDGAGWTKDGQGRRVVREYLLRNREVSEFAAFAWVDLPLSVGQAEIRDAS